HRPARRRPPGRALARPGCPPLAGGPGLTHVRPRTPVEQPAMDPFQPNTGTLPPALRALALGLLVEAVMPLLDRTCEDTPEPPGQRESGPDARVELWQALRGKCAELSALVLRADHPGEAADYVLRYLPKHIEYVFEQLYGRKRRPMLDELQAGCPPALRNGHAAEPA